MLRAPGLIEFRGQRNALTSPGMRVTTVWSSMSDWARFTQSDKGQTIRNALGRHACNLRVEVGSPSPYLPGPVKAIG